MIAAPAGTQVDGYTLAPACAEGSGRYPLCLTHGTTFPDPQALALHLQKKLVQRTPCFIGTLCTVHGPEAR